MFRRNGVIAGIAAALVQASGAAAQAPSAARAASQGSEDRPVITAVEATQPVRLDGSLDDEVWQRAVPASGFVQSEPAEAQPATQPTEVRVAFDADNLYIGAFCRDSDMDGVIISDIREDFEWGDQDAFQVVIDTFGDRTNGYIFSTNPEGARADEQITNEGREVNTSWDAVWNVRTQRLADGWTVEMAIPFKSLRFNEGVQQVWGINFSRRIRRVNEVTYWSFVPRQFRIARVSLAGTLQGVVAGASSRNIRIKPYVLGRNVRPTGGASFDGDADLGVDAKFGVTPSLTLDATVNPDFAQAEADEQQVNLTQFSIFYPEKRDFFLENSGVFYVGDASRSVVSGSTSTAPRLDTDLYYFFSRRIGLTPDGEPIPILGGARLSGAAGGLNVGLMTVQTRDTATTPNNNYTIARIRKAMRNNTAFVGGILMARQNSDVSSDYNRVYGLDANVRLWGVDFSTQYFDTFTPGIIRDKSSFRASSLFERRQAYSGLTYVQIGKNFNDEMGYYRRLGIRKYIADMGLRPRPQVLQRHGIREIQPHINWNYYTDFAGRYIARNFHTAFAMTANNGSFVDISLQSSGDTLDRPFRIHRGDPPIAPGVYRWTEFRGIVRSDASRLLSGSVNWGLGQLWTGTQRSVTLTATLKPSYRFRTSLGIQRTSASLDAPDIDFVTAIWTSRTNYSFSNNMYLDALLQYDVDQDLFNANVRFNLIHHPLSDLYVVYNEQRFTTDPTMTAGRGLIVKFTQMFSF
ncbi:MAG: carbohydrate binding family 9 domain-containing protein [Acidobacteria bacterium]|nr:carbohydrate binding family 9 domain-containing protein [Acidobacteriota bacterium]